MEPPGALFSMDLLARRLAEVCPLSKAERELLLQRQQHPRSYCAGSVMSDERVKRTQPKLIVSGWACRERVLHNGRRQLLSILLPGDLIGNCSEQRALDLVEIVAISDVRLMNIAEFVRTVEEDPDRYTGIIDGLSALRFSEERRLLDHMVRLGSQPALQRIAGFILELFQRCRAIGFVSGGSFVMPLTQEMVGDALGLSVVHVNRVMRQLKADHLIDLHAGIFRIQDAAGLALAAGFEPADYVRAPAHRISH
jgi:CRP-like cAMP-binding protein